MDPQTRLANLDAGASPVMIAKLESGYAVMGDNQYLPGYCLLLASPLVERLNDLQGSTRALFLSEMALLGDAVLAATACARINYGIYGNLDKFLHVHIWPRYDWENPEHTKIPPFLFPEKFRTEPKNDFSLELHGKLIDEIRAALLNR
jgi:diadenosine tetraphosphate (Ap4A) HIT family hydrolase